MNTGFPKASGVERVREALSRRGWLGLLAFLTVAAIGVTLIASIPDVYKSSATVLVQQMGTTPAAGIEDRLEIIREKTFSRPRLEELIERFDLYPDLRKRLSVDDVVEQMRHDIRIAPQRAGSPAGSGATIAFTISHRGARDPKTSAQVANELARFAVEEEARLRDEGAGNSSSSLKPQLDALRARLAEQERRLAGFRAQHQLQGDADLAMTALQRLGAQRELLADQRTRLIGRREDLLRHLEVVDPATRPFAGEERLQALRVELAELNRRYSDKYPDVIRLKQQIATLEQQAGASGPAGGGVGRTDELRRTLAELDSELAGLSREESRMRAEIGQAYRRLQSPSQQQGLLEASRDYETTKAVYDSLLKQYQEAVLSTGDAEPGQPSSQLRVLDPAVEPKEPVSPNRPRLLMMVLLLAFGVACGLVLLSERLDSTFHSVDDLRGFTRVPVLASIPRLQTRADAWRQSMRVALASAGSVVGLFLLVQLTLHYARGNEYLALLLASGS
jgi:polysaccharide chain length determinant protein (PEP-CTERM system associated)